MTEDMSDDAWKVWLFSRTVQLEVIPAMQPFIEVMIKTANAVAAFIEAINTPLPPSNADRRRFNKKRAILVHELRVEARRRS